MDESKFFEQPQGEKKEKIDILKAEMIELLKNFSSRELYEAYDRFGLKVPSYEDSIVRTEDGEEWSELAQQELQPLEVKKIMRQTLTDVIKSTPSLSEVEALFRKMANNKE